MYSLSGLNNTTTKPNKKYHQQSEKTFQTCEPELPTGLTTLPTIQGRCLVPTRALRVSAPRYHSLTHKPVHTFTPHVQ